MDAAEGTPAQLPADAAGAGAPDAQEGPGAGGAPGGCGEPPDAPRPSGEATPMERAQRILGVDPHRLAERLKAARREKAWTRLRLSQEAGVAPSTVGNLEQEKSESPDPLVVLALALALGFESAGELLGEPEAAPRGASALAGHGPMTLEQVIESLLRGVWAAQAGLSRTPATVRLGEGSDAGPAEAVAAEVAPAGPGAVTLNVPLVVLVQPRTVG
jgi:transcriptional regulator with XRE-family HTH domain